MEASGPEYVVGIGILLYFACIGLAMLFGVVSLAFWIWMIIDCVSNEPDTGNDKVVWVLIIILLSWIGALVYFFFRRPQRRAQFGK